MSDDARYHSVVLDEEACKGCTICVTTCPAEAIRVQGGKARIMAERCIDCGECIRRCPNHAKKARADELGALADPQRFASFDWKIALPAPSLYGQFAERYSIGDIHAALCAIGFDEVFPVASATPSIAATARSFLDSDRYPGIARPLISSSCPTIIKFIQIRFPTLLDHIVPVIAPMELAGRMARTRAIKRFADASTIQERKTVPRIGCFFISPCSGKITEAKAPLGNETTSIDGVFSIKDIHLPLLAELVKSAKDATSNRSETVPNLSEEIAWGRAGGEAEATITDSGHSWIAVDGMDQCIKILGEIDNGKLSNIDFLELMACTGGCVGGPLSIENPVIARHTIREREKRLKNRISADGNNAFPDHTSQERKAATEDCLRKERFPARSALLLDPEYEKALSMMEEMEKIYGGLPGLDCGCCGEPNCHALAEDIVRGNADRTDCVIILKEQYRELLEKEAGET